MLFFSIYQCPIKYSSACLCLSLKVCHSNRTEFGGSYVTSSFVFKCCFNNVSLDGHHTSD